MGSCIGQRFGRLIVIEQFYKFTGRCNTTWFTCECDCGTIKDYHSGSIRQGTTKSCGCLHKETVSLSPGVSTLNNLYYHYKYNANIRKLDFDLTIEYFQDLIKQNCYYCGIIPSKILKCKGYNGEYTYNGIDRENNKDSYVVGNCFACCEMCNKSKHAYRTEELNQWLDRITKFRLSK